MLCQIKTLIFVIFANIPQNLGRRFSTQVNVGGLNEVYPDYEACDGGFLWGEFPTGFQWGAATSAYQVEGAWDVNGRGPSVWDEFVHRSPSPIADGSTGNVACDSYHNYPVDVKLLKQIGVNFYRFSISWPRLFPDGKLASKNQDGIDYYNKLINLLIENGIQPVVTIFHWDLPLALGDIGGWLNEDLILYYAHYAYSVFDLFGDRVKTWITFNEAANVCVLGYENGTFPPGATDGSTNAYICGNTILKAHAVAYRIYDTLFRAGQNGRVGMTMHTFWFEPGTGEKNDIQAAERALQFDFGWFAEPMYSGNYPKVMRDLIARKSFEAGLSESRLPVLDAKWQNALKGSYDFFGLNHYSTELVKDQETTVPGWYGDQDVYTYINPNWQGSAVSWLNVVPWGFRKLLNWIKTTYDNPVVIVTENGFAGPQNEGLDDKGRVDYYKEYINNLLKAVTLEGCNVVGYSVWGFLDDFEWDAGYTVRFGLHHVDFDSLNRTRTPKESASYYAKIVAQNGFV